MLAAIELEHKINDLAHLYILLEQRINQYLTNSDDCYHDNEAGAPAVRSVQKTLFRAMREREMKNLRSQIMTNNQHIQRIYALMIEQVTDPHEFEKSLAESFLATYQLLWEYFRRLPEWNKHKGQAHSCEGKFAHCIYDLLGLMEYEVSSGHQAHLSNYLPPLHNIQTNATV